MAPSKASMTNASVSADFANNRAEQVGPDVTGYFIAPPFLIRNRLDQQRQSVRVMGGRGCGKTMFLRFFSHHSQLSADAVSIADSIFEQGIGLYWRADTGFCDLLKPQWLGDQTADSAFRHHISVVVIETLCDFVEKLAVAPLSEGRICLISRPLPQPAMFVLQGPSTYGELKLWATQSRLELSKWAQNPDLKKPIFIRVDEILNLLCEDLSRADARLAKLFIRVFVDEFENLKDNQRRLVCDLIKHPTQWFSFNFAMRRDSVDSFLTSSGEQVVDVHDFRTISLEDEFRHGDDFELMAAELLLMKLRKNGWQVHCDEFDIERLHDPARLSERLQPSYKSSVIGAAKRILPTKTLAEIAKSIFSEGNEPLQKRLAHVAMQGIKRHSAVHNIDPSSFISEEWPEASIVAPFIMNRSSWPPEKLLAEFTKYTSSDLSENDGPFPGWIHNNLFGCLLFLYFGLPQRPNPLYAGFVSFCTMSKPNLRFFGEFCYSSLQIMAENSANGELFGRHVVPVDAQALAAKEASDLLLQKVAQLGDEGKLLQRVVKRLGRLFQVAQLRMTQSEAEINHFSIDEADMDGLSAASVNLLRQARIWSVIYEQADTKNKSDKTAVQTDYIPNPIFNPFFRISYRRKKKLLLNASEVNVITSGTDEDFESVLTKYKNQWDQVGELRSGLLFE